MTFGARTVPARNPHHRTRCREQTLKATDDPAPRTNPHQKKGGPSKGAATSVSSGPNSVSNQPRELLPVPTPTHDPKITTGRY
jgi:hypothetical protein